MSEYSVVVSLMSIMRKNNTRNFFGVVPGRSGSGKGLFVSQSPEQQATPPRPAMTTLSSRLPIILDYRQKMLVDPFWQYVSQNYISSDAITRSPVAGRSPEAYAAYEAVPDKSELITKSRSVNLARIGAWSRQHGSMRASSQNAIMGEAAHQRITGVAQALESSAAETLQVREGASPTHRSHWLHLIAYSLSDFDPQVPSNLVAGSAGANYDHVIFENVVQDIAKIEFRERFGVVNGVYSVTAKCLPGHVAVLIECELELQLCNGSMKKISFTFDPAKPKLTDAAVAKHDEEVIKNSIIEFIQTPISLRPSATSHPDLSERVVMPQVRIVEQSSVTVPLTTMRLEQLKATGYSPRELFDEEGGDADMTPARRP